MYIYHVLINALGAHIIHINLNTIFYKHVEHSPTKTIYIKYYMETHTYTHTMSGAYETDRSKIASPLRLRQQQRIPHLCTCQLGNTSR